jgi:predicted O-methyltransferase YrrM
MGKNASAKHISEVGNYGDKREFYASKYVLEHAPRNDPDALLGALEYFDVRWTMLHLGKEKGEYLDMAVRDLISERRSMNQQTESTCRSPNPIRALEVGTYIGYSAIRIGSILATEADDGSTLLSVEQNVDNAGYAKTHVEHAGLNKTVKVLHSKVENCFDDEKSSATNDEIENNVENGDASSLPLYCHDNRRPYDFVFFDHRKPFYLRDLKLLESRGVIDAAITTVVADNVASLEHIKNREESIARGKRKGPCKCVNKACDYLEYVRRRWSSTEIFYGTNTKDGISVSKPSLGGGGGSNLGPTG